MKKLFSRRLCVALTFGLTGCLQDPDFSSPPHYITPFKGDVPSGVHVDVERQLQLTDAARLPESDSSLNDVDVFDGKLIFEYSDAPLLPLEVGHVVAGTSEGGYLRRITAVGGTDRYLETTTEPAELVDFIADGEFTITVSPYLEDWRPTSGTVQQRLGSPMSLFQAAQQSVGRLADLAECSGELTAEGLDVEPFAEFNPSFIARIDIEQLQLKTAEFRVRGALESGLELGFLAKATGSCSIDFMRLVPTSTRGFEFEHVVPVGGIPILLSHSLVPVASARVNAELQAGANAKSSTTYGLEFGAVYDGSNWDAVSELDREAEASVDARDRVDLAADLTLGFEHRTKLYDTFGPTTALSSSMLGRFSTDLLCNYKTQVAVQVKGAVGLTLDVPVVDETLYELGYQTTLAQAIVYDDDGVLGTGICEPPPLLEEPPEAAVLVFASGELTDEMGMLEISVSPQDGDGNFVGQGLVSRHFMFDNTRMTPAYGGASIDLDTSVLRVEVDEPPMTEGLTAVVIFDSSGSMSDNDPGAAGRLAGGEALISRVARGDRVAFLDFGAGSTAPHVASRELQAFTDDTDALTAALDALTEDGDTPLFQSLLDGLSLLDGELQEGGVIVVLTDGVANDSSLAEAVISQAQARRTPIFAIGLGTALDFATLTDLGQRTRGGFALASDSSGLETTFNGISAGISLGRVTVVGHASYPTPPELGRYEVTGELVMLPGTSDELRTPFNFVTDLTASAQ